MNRFKTLAVVAVAASALTLAAAPKAEAGLLPWGAIAAGVVVGGAAAAIASSRSAHADPLPPYGSCYMVRRWVETPSGPAVRRIRVCD